ncbi:MAG: hypothetical protein WC979_01490 [Candidatus Pacearchaeota archaeon]|jgi:hypothetical protein|nr:hypothetical protein [Clostridia bacterium]
MTLTEEQKTRALEIFTSFVELQKEIDANQEKLNNLSTVQQQLSEKVEQIRTSEVEWMHKISKETGIEIPEISKHVGNFILSEIEKLKK